MRLHRWVARWRGQVGNRRSRSRSSSAVRRARRLSLEALERRLAPAVTGLLGTLPTARSAAIASRAATVAADAAWLDDIARVVLDTSLPSGFVSLTAAELARGLSPRTAMLRLLRTPAARIALARQDFQLLLGQPATPAELNSPISAAERGTDQRLVLATIAASPVYYDHAGGDATDYQAAIANDLLGGNALPAALARLPVRTARQRDRFVSRVEQTPVFARVWAARLAGIALEQGTFPPGLLRIATGEIHQPDGFNLALSRFLATPLSRTDVERRAIPPTPTPTPVPQPMAAPALTVGPTLSQYFGLNQQSLVPDPVTDPPAYGDSPTASGSGVPMDSPWDDAVVFPEVPYATIMTGAAAQPSLSLPTSLVSQLTSSLSTGVTFQTWFQAKGPGALLSETLIVGGSTTEAPLVYINSAGDLVAGLFDGTSLAVNSGETVLNWNPTGGAVGGDPGQGPYQIGASDPVVSQVTVVDNTWHQLAFVVSGQSEALYLDGLLQGEIQPSDNSPYSFTPTLLGGDTVSAPGGFIMGGAIVPELDAVPDPQINYPQGFVGTIDEVAAWTNALTQAQVQTAMTAPIAKDSGLDSGLAAYFNFGQTPSNGAWPNQAPGETGTAQGPTTGTTLAQVPTTIPTDPFPDSQRLPGARDWGIDIAMPLSAPTINIGQSVGDETVSYKVGLDAGDELEIKVPDGYQGSLTVQVESDLGTDVSDSSAPITGGNSTYLSATRTGTYNLTLTWSPDSSPSAMVDFYQVPGPLNSLMELATSYTRQGPSNVIYNWAYSDPTLPTINDNAGNLAGDTAAANYWPLWSDATYFPVPAGTGSSTWAAGLSDAYATLVQNSGLSSGFANLVGAQFGTGTDIPQVLSKALSTGWSTAYPNVPAPTLPNGDMQFPVQPTATPQEEVYEFLYNADVMRTNEYDVLADSGSGTLPSWVQGYYDELTSSADVPESIATEIASGQDNQTANEVNTNSPSNSSSTVKIIEEAGIEAAGALFAAILGLSGVGLPVLGAVLGAAGASLGSSLLEDAGVPQYIGQSVPVQQLTTDILNATQLNDLATNITDDTSMQWANIENVLENVTFVETYLSNYGLFNSFQYVNGTQLDTSTSGDSGTPMPLDPTTGADQLLTNLSWSAMIPAVFHWSPTPAGSLPTSDGQTTDLSYQSISLNGPQNQNGPDGAYDVATGEFFNNATTPNDDLDLAVTDQASSEVSIVEGNGNGTFSTLYPPVTLAGGTGPRGIAVGNFINGSPDEDLAVADYNTSNVTILIGNGNGGFTATAQSPVSLGGPDLPQDIAVGNFVDTSSNEDLAVTDYQNSEVTILIGDGQGNFTANQPLGLNGPDGPWGIAVGDFYNHGQEDLAVADNITSAVTIMKGDGTGNFVASNPIYLSARSFPTEIAAADFNGDGNLDLAVADTGDPNDNVASSVSILLGNGQGNFQVSTIPLNSGDTAEAITAVKLYGSIFPDLAVTYQVNSEPGVSGVVLLINEGNGTFLAPIYYNLSGSLGTQGIQGIVAGDFLGDGFTQLVVANTDTSDLGFISGTTAGNFATFLPSSANSSAIELGDTQALQGANPIAVGPINSINLISPSTSNPPDYLGYISLPYYPDGGPLEVDTAGDFVSVTPAQLQESASGFSFDQSGSIITAWELVDANDNPIATSTAASLFGAPATDNSVSTTIETGTALTPIDPSQPFAGLNGGWYYAAKTAPNASATWADAFFNWGNGITGYSPRNLIPNFDPGTGTGQESGTLPGTSASFPSDFNYTLTYSAQTGAPPDVGTAVNLGGAFNILGIASDGATFSGTGGLDGMGTALSAQSLPQSVFFNGVLLNLSLPAYIYNSPAAIGETDTSNAISADGQTIDLPAGMFNTLTFLGSAVNGGQFNQPFTVTYTDGTTQTFIQSMSDWFVPQNFTGESVADSTPYRDLADGTIQRNTYNIYGYSFQLQSGKTVKSITLPDNSNVTILAMTLG